MNASSGTLIQKKIDLIWLFFALTYACTYGCRRTPMSVGSGLRG
jgi:hypothetical protein